MARKIMQWVLITALLLTVTWRPFANHQMPLDFAVFAGAVMVVMALFFIKHRIETLVDNESNPAKRVTVKL